MKTMRMWACLAALLLVGALGQPQAAESEDVFAFIPSGGRTLLTQVVQSRPPAQEVRALLTGKHTREEWLGYLKARTGALPALKALSDKELLTLADYLSFNMPLPVGKVPAELAKADWGKVLPQDGRDLAMNNCQFCHIITVVVTQARTKTAWLGTMHKPSHIEIELSEPQREALASYLVINAGIPADLVPEELRAGGASY
ncbi:MAG TPA: hypothetical protein VKB51_19340 [bacterium]|nr:hypothetical protein [bacterium]